MGELERRSKTQGEITHEECNYSCRLDDKKFPEPNRTEKWVKLSDINEMRKEFDVICPNKNIAYLKRVNPLACQLVECIVKWLGDKNE